MENKMNTLEDLVRIIRILRGENGCPWDRVQTHASIRMDMLEEAYEAADAIDKKDMKNLCEELGDVLMQVVFHAEIETEQGGFTMGDVIQGICEKMIYRHPHVFGSGKADTAEEVRALRQRGIRVAAVFMGENASVPDARTIYGHDLVRIQRMDQLAAAAGKLIQEEIRELSG